MEWRHTGRGHPTIHRTRSAPGRFETPPARPELGLPKTTANCTKEQRQAAQWFAQLHLEVEALERRGGCEEYLFPSPLVAKEDVACAVGRLNALIQKQLLVADSESSGHGSVLTMLHVQPGCNTDELVAIARTLEGCGNHAAALQLRAALVMNATSIDEHLLADLDAILLLNAESFDTMSQQFLEGLLVHCRALYWRCKCRQGQGRSRSHPLGAVILRLEGHLRDAEYMALLDKVGKCVEEIVAKEPPRSSTLAPARRRTFEAGDSVDMRKLTPRPRGTPRLRALRKVWVETTGSALQNAFSRWVDTGLLICQFADDDNGERAIRCIELKPDCSLDELSEVAEMAKSLETGDTPVVALLLWVALAMNSSAVDADLISTLNSILALAGRPSMLDTSIWRTLGKLCAHAIALKELAGVEEARDLQIAIDGLRRHVDFSDNELSREVQQRRAAIPALVRRQQEAEWGAETLCSWGFEPGEIGICTADPEAMAAFARLVQLERFVPRLEIWARKERAKFRGFEVLGAGDPGDVAIVARMFDLARRSDVALQLFVAHMTQIIELADADLPCLSEFVRIAEVVDLTDDPAMRAIWSIVLHLRLLLKCELCATEHGAKALAAAEMQAREACKVWNDATDDSLPHGEVDGICRILAAMAIDSASDMNMIKAKAIEVAAVSLAVDNPGAGRARIRCCMQWAVSAGALGPGDPISYMDKICLDEQAKQTGGLKAKLTQCGIKIKMKKIPGGNDWQRKPVVVTLGDSTFTASSHGGAVVAYANALLNDDDTRVSQVFCCIEFLDANCAACDAVQLAGLLALTLRCAARWPDVLNKEPVVPLLTALLSDEFVLQSLLDGGMVDLPVVMLDLVVGLKDLASQPSLWRGLRRVVDSAEFRAAIASGSGPWMLDQALRHIREDPLLLNCRPVRVVVHRMAMRRARRCSRWALAQPILLRALCHPSQPCGPAMVECLLMWAGDKRNSEAADAVIGCAQRQWGGEGGEQAVVPLLKSQPGSSLRSSSDSKQPELAKLESHWAASRLGAGVANELAGSSDRTLEVLADAFRTHRNASGNAWRNEAKGLAFALRVALRAVCGQPDDVLDRAVTAPVQRGSGKAGRSELFAQASLAACQFLLTQRALPLREDTEAALLAHLMCAALMLELQEHAHCRAHLQWVETRESEVVTSLFGKEWIRVLRKRLQSELPDLE